MPHLNLGFKYLMFMSVQVDTSVLPWDSAAQTIVESLMLSTKYLNIVDSRIISFLPPFPFLSSSCPSKIYGLYFLTSGKTGQRVHPTSSLSPSYIRTDLPCVLISLWITSVNYRTKLTFHKNPNNCYEGPCLGRFSHVLWCVLHRGESCVFISYPWLSPGVTF